MNKKLLLTTILLFFYSLLLNSQTTQLTVRGFSEGFYRSSTGMMVAVLDPVNFPLVCDTVLIELIDTLTMEAEFCTDELISTDGYATCTVPSALNGKYYYTAVKFRNTFHLLSKEAIQINGFPISVDLTIPQNTCCNFDTTFGVAKAICGDVNNDGTLDGGDFLIIDADIQNQVTGYAITDLTGNGIVDSIDYNIFVNNLNDGWADDYQGGCSTIGISELENFSVQVYPNPCRDYFTISLEQTYTNIEFTLYDIFGKKHLEQNFGAERDLKLSGENLLPGIYFIRVTADGLGMRQGMVIRE